MLEHFPGIQISLKSAFIGPRANLNHPFIAMIVEQSPIDLAIRSVLFHSTYANPVDTSTTVKMSGAWAQNNSASMRLPSSNGALIIPTILLMQLLSYVIAFQITARSGLDWNELVELHSPFLAMIVHHQPIDDHHFHRNHDQHDDDSPTTILFHTTVTNPVVTSTMVKASLWASSSSSVVPSFIVWLVVSLFAVKQLVLW
ncbi:hypothetical protein Fcan01_09647 [Folsomia candida]|uniref:Uncharacterized protein n=1 Tax=Folsomia candida TaxID=158441 RepID=A0A226ECH9_FOLCA|nr:hypothetical protein Fcan01_09647 [Folsomia candida]